MCIETMVDLAARELGIDPAELRRRNTIPAGGDAVQDRAHLHLRLRRLRQEPRRRAADRRLCRLSARAARVAQKRGKLRGIGISNTVEASNVGPDRARRDSASIRPARSPCWSARTITARATRPRSARSSPTSSASIPSRIALPATATPTRSTIGTGTFGSRSTVARRHRASLIAADKIIAKGKKIAAHLMEAAEHDIVFERGKFTVAGTDRALDIAQIARDAFVPAKLADAASSPACSRPAPSTAASAPSPTAATSARSRSTRTPAWSSSCATPRSTTSAT